MISFIRRGVESMIPAKRPLEETLAEEESIAVKNAKRRRLGLMEDRDGSIITSISAYFNHIIRPNKDHRALRRKMSLDNRDITTTAVYDSSVLDEEDVRVLWSSPRRASGGRVGTVGGSDGLLDPLDDDIIEEPLQTSFTRVASQFRFGPSAAAPAPPRRPASSRRPRPHAQPPRRHSLARVSNNTICKPRATDSGLTSALGRLGLSKRYTSAARESYKMMDRDVYQQMLASSAAGSTPTSCRASIASPLVKTKRDPEWARRTMLQIEQEEAKVPQVIALWSKPESNQVSVLSGKHGYTAGKHSNGVGAHSNGGSHSNLAGKHDNRVHKSTSDDDLVIVKEDVRKVVQPSSLEKDARFSAFHKYTPEYFSQRAQRCEDQVAALAVGRQESQAMVVASRSERQPSQVEAVVARRLKLLSLQYPARADDGEEDDLAQLSKEMERVVSNALAKGNPQQPLTEKFSIQITRRDVATLSGLQWLNDEVINFYMNLLMERGRAVSSLPTVHAFNTFFYPTLLKRGFAGVKRWTRKVDIFAHELLLVPVHLGVHWCLATINTQEKMIRYYDSMLGDNPEALAKLKGYLHDEHKDKRGSALDFSGWRTEAVKDIPRQMNGSDCGMFACKFSEYLSRRKPITFTQDHMPYFRRRMVYEILSNKLM